MSTKKQREASEAWDRIKDVIRDCGPEGMATLEVLCIATRPSSSGRTHYLALNVWRIGRDGRPERVEWLTRNAATTFGWTFNERQEAISMGGYGYSREQQIADCLTHKAGHPIRFEGQGFGSVCGWYPKAPPGVEP